MIPHDQWKREEIESNIQDSNCECTTHSSIQIDMQKDLKIYALRDVCLSLLLVYYYTGILLKEG